MKKLLLIGLLFARLGTGHATTLIPFPLSTTSIAGTNAGFWEGGIPIDPTTGITVWQLVKVVKTNIDLIQLGFNGLTDTQTNAALNSAKKVAYTTNNFTITYGTTNWVRFIVTNYAGMDYTVAGGVPTPMLSFNYGTNWVPWLTASTLITNVPVAVGWQVAGLPPSSSLYMPVDGVVSNLTFYTLARPDLFGRTNAQYGEALLTGVPLQPDQVANKKYVDGLFASTAWWSAENDVQINGHTVSWNGAWETVADSPGTNTDRWHLSYLGSDVVSIQQPSGQTITNAHISISGTNLTVTAPTNGLTGPFSLKASHLISPVSWFWLGNGPATLSGTNYTLTFGQPWSDSGFFLAVVPSALPGSFSLSGVLQLTPRTITNSTDSTWGHGAGLVSADGSYVYISTGSNVWKRAALSTW